MAVSNLIRIDIRGQLVDLPKRAQNRQIYKAVHAAAGKFWDTRFLRLHFLASAGARYKYQSRAKATTEKKLRLAKRGFVQEGGRVDLVFFGRLKKAMGYTHSIRATPSKVTINLPAPGYVLARPRTRLNMRDEIIRVIPTEQNQIAAESERALKAATEYEAKNRRYKKRI